MSSGRERAVQVWAARHALALRRLEVVERALAEQRGMEEAPSRKRRERLSELEEERRQLMLTLARLGPCPQPKMG